MLSGEGNSHLEEKSWAEMVVEAKGQELRDSESGEGQDETK